jgi:CRISPR/Cas system-associated endonuclease Cas1
MDELYDILEEFRSKLVAVFVNHALADKEMKQEHHLVSYTKHQVTHT